jgi:hypothetical protein
MRRFQYPAFLILLGSLLGLPLLLPPKPEPELIIDDPPAPRVRKSRQGRFSHYRPARVAERKLGWQCTKAS